MSLLTTQSLFQYAIAVLGQSFSPPMECQNTSDFVVTYTNPTTLADTTLTNGLDYVISGASTEGIILAPTLTLEAAGLHYATGGTLTIQRKPPATQPTTYVDGTKYPASVPNNSLNWIVYAIQALTDIASRCLQVPATSPTQSAIALAVRKGMLAGWDASGNFTQYAPVAGVGVQPFPVSLNPSYSIFLPGVTAITGGGATQLDGLDITAVTQIIEVILTFGGNTDVRQCWKLRPYISGDLNVSDGTTTVVPVVNPSNLRWIRTS